MTVNSCQPGEQSGIQGILPQYGARGRRTGPFNPMVALLLILLTFIGCADEPLQFTEAKRIDEVVTRSEFKSFLKVIHSLPHKKLPEFRSVFIPAADWESERTLEVRDLTQEEILRAEQQWELSNIAVDLKRNRHLQRALRLERMTTEQFIGMALTIGMAISRQELRDDQNLSTIIEDGEIAIAELRENREQFSKLTRAAQYAVLRKAAWVARHDRAVHLAMVPAENLSLVARYKERLDPIFPQYLKQNPLDPIADEFKELGIPFHVSRDGEFSDLLEWDPRKAIGGTQNASHSEFESEFTPR